MKRFIIALLLAVSFCTTAQAASYYVCDTAENTGSDSNDGSLANPWLTASKAIQEISALDGGDNLYFCEGYDETSTANDFIESSGTCDEATPCTIDKYTPSGQDAGDDGVLPKITNTTYNVLQFDAATLQDGGYVFNNLHLVGDSSTNCVDIASGFSNVTFNTVTFDSCAIGVDITVIADEVSIGIDVIDGTWTNVTDIGYRGSSTRGSIQGGTMTNVGNSTSDHAILLRGIDTSDFTVKNITITDTAIVSTACSSPVIQAEGSFRGLYFTEVHVNETQATAAAACIGILLDGDYGAEAAHFNYVQFAKVTTAWTGTSGIACANCTNVYMDHNIVIGDDAITTGIDIPYGTESGVTSNYVDIYKTYMVLIGNDTGRTGIRADVAKGSFTKNQIFENDTDDVCWERTSGIDLDDNLCWNSVVGGLDPSTNTVTN